MIKELKRWFDTESVRILEDEFSLINERLKVLERRKNEREDHYIPVSGYTAPPDEPYLQLENNTFSYRLNKERS